MKADTSFNKKLHEAGVVFRPYVGENYDCGLILDNNGRLTPGTPANPGIKIAILNESHYCEAPDTLDDLWEFTQVMIKDYIESEQRFPWMRSFEKFGCSLKGESMNTEERKVLWNHLSFYNYLQRPIENPRIFPSQELFDQSAKPFKVVLDELQPDAIIVWGYRLWRELPYEGWSEAPLLVDGEEMPCGYYTLDSGKRVNALVVYHPSVGFSWDYWHEVIAQFISTVKQH